MVHARTGDGTFVSKILGPASVNPYLAENRCQSYDQEAHLADQDAGQQGNESHHPATPFVHTIK